MLQLPALFYKQLNYTSDSYKLVLNYVYRNIYTGREMLLLLHLAETFHNT